MTAQATPFRAAADHEPRHAGPSLGLDLGSFTVAAMALAIAVSLIWNVGIPRDLAGFVLACVLAAIGALMLFAIPLVPESERKAWHPVAMAVLAAAAGQVVWVVFGDAPALGPRLPAVPDLVTVVFYAMMVVGLLRMPFVPGSRFGTLRTAMDVMAGMAATAAVLWQLQGRVFDQGPAAPLIHAALLGAMLVALLRQSPYVLDVRLATLLVALVPIILITRLSAGSAPSQSLVLWSVSATCLAMVSWQMRRPQTKQNLILARPATWRLILPYAPVAGLVAMFYQQVVEGVDLSASPLSWAALVVTVAVAVRSWAATRENRRLIEIERDQLLASISHQLRTPLTAVAGFSDVLDVNWAAVPEPDKREMVGIIREESSDLVEIVSDMAALARSELDAAVLHRERLEGKTIIAEAIRQVFDVSGPIPVKAEVEPYLELIGDRRRLVQMLKALLENAQRYGNGKILVVARRDKNGRTIEVHDDGSGVAPRYTKIIWRRFERGEHELNAHVPGSGLGLAVVRALARAHGGEAHYRRSDRLGGSCFTIELPYASDATVSRG